MLRLIGGQTLISEGCMLLKGNTVLPGSINNCKCFWLLLAFLCPCPVTVNNEFSKIRMLHYKELKKRFQVIQAVKLNSPLIKRFVPGRQGTQRLCRSPSACMYVALSHSLRLEHPKCSAIQSAGKTCSRLLCLPMLTCMGRCIAQ